MIKALFKLELLFVFQDGAKARKKAPSARTTLVESATKENDVKKSQMRVEEKGTASVSQIRRPRLGGLSEKCSDLCLDLHLAGLHSFVDGGVLPA